MPLKSLGSHSHHLMIGEPRDLTGGLSIDLRLLDLPVPPHGRWMPAVRPAGITAALYCGTFTNLPPARLHLSSDFGEDLREPDLPSQEPFERSRQDRPSRRGQERGGGMSGKQLPWWAYVLLAPPCFIAAIWIGGGVINRILEMGGG